MENRIGTITLDQFVDNLRIPYGKKLIVYRASRNEDSVITGELMGYFGSNWDQFYKKIQQDLDGLDIPFIDRTEIDVDPYISQCGPDRYIYNENHKETALWIPGRLKNIEIDRFLNFLKKYTKLGVIASSKNFDEGVEYIEQAINKSDLKYYRRNIEFVTLELGKFSMRGMNENGQRTKSIRK
ncbi:MAG: hypothetical protein ACOYT4_03520 [Nanoarchaeota archaeon]